MKDTGIGLIPQPQSVQFGDGEWVVPEPLPLRGPESWRRRARRLLGGVLDLDEVAGAAGADGLELVDDQRPDAGYSLQVTESGVRLAAGGDAGLVAGLATLLQLLPAWAAGAARPAAVTEPRLPLVRIEDAPALAWRGLHLDVARHFQPMESILALVDQLHRHKLNVLHLHLTDDQGWRLPVPGLPRLTELGAVRAETRVPWAETGDGTAHGGHYSTEQLRALVAYAAERGITVLPEVDVPGHARALLRAYPEFGEPGGPELPVSTEFGVHEEVLHLSDACLAALETIFETVLDIFDSTEIHVGGDECPTTQWEQSAAAKELAADRGLSDATQLQPWLTAWLSSWLAARGRRLIGWDEIVEGAEVPGAVVMCWRGRERATDALARGYQVVLAPESPLYFDHYQAEGADEPLGFIGLNTLADVLAHDPLAGLDQQARERVLGIQGQLWSEYLPDPRTVQYAAFPRSLALAEVAWTGAPADEADFSTRLGPALARLDAAGVEYRPLAGPLPWQVGSGARRRPDAHRAPAASDPG